MTRTILSTSTEGRNPGIDLATGWPNPSLLTPALLAQSSTKILSDVQIYPVALTYGADEGYHPLRVAVAKWLSTFYCPKSGDIGYQRICITGGASQNVACVLQTFTDPVYTRNVWMVAPTYYNACRIFDDSGFAGRLKGVPEDAEGIDLEYLKEALAKSEKEALEAGNTEPRLKQPRPWRRIFKHVIYAVPTFANPSGRVMSLRRREELVRIAREYDALILTDDVYDMLQWSSSPKTLTNKFETAVLPRIVDIDRYLDGGPVTEYGNAVSNGSFSKLNGPGCRTGWAEGTEALAYGLSQTGTTRSGGAPSQLVSTFICDMLSNGSVQRHIDEVLKPAYGERYHKMIAAISEHLLPLGLTMPQPNNTVAGGYFIWLTLPKPLRGEHVASLAQKDQQVTIMPGSRFRVLGDEDNEDTRFDRDIRLCFAWADTDSLQEGVTRLAKVIQKELARK